MKKSLFCSGLKCALMFFLILLPFTALAQELGDVNGDGSITITDALAIMQYTIGAKPAVFFPEAADVQGCDGTINVLDALTIARYTVGIISEFPCAPFKYTIEYTTSGGFAGFVYTYTIDSAKKQLLFNDDGVITTYNLTQTQIKELGKAAGYVGLLAYLPNDTKPCCCDRFQHGLTINSQRPSYVVKCVWTDCTTDVPTAISKLITLIRAITDNQTI